MTRPFGPPDAWYDPPDEDDAAEERSRARAILDLVSEELASLSTLDRSDRKQMAEDLGGLLDTLERYIHLGDWGAWDVVDDLYVALKGGHPLDLAPANALIATLEEAAREPQFSPDFEPAWEE